MIGHSLSCKLGEYVIMRHNHIRDTVAEIMKEVWFDVQTEPHLIPVEPSNLTLAHSNKEPNARLDISGRGIWSPFDRSFVDIEIMHPNCPANENKSLETILLQHKKEKKILIKKELLK